MVAEKRLYSKLLDPGNKLEKIFQMDDHITAAVSGITADANTLIQYARLTSQQVVSFSFFLFLDTTFTPCRFTLEMKRSHFISLIQYTFQYQEPIPVEELVTDVCNLKQGYTQHGGLRPFGVSFLYAGYDVHHGFQLYHSDPSGNYSGWRATAIGAKNQSAQSILKQEYRRDIGIKEALQLTIKVMSKVLDNTTLNPEKLECIILTKGREHSKPKVIVLSQKQIGELLESCEIIKEDK